MGPAVPQAVISQTLSTERKLVGWIVWSYIEKNAFPPSQQLPANILFSEGVPEYIGDAHGDACLVILDDLLNDVYSKQVCDLFTRGIHHRYVSVILITQNLFHQDRFCRDIYLNAYYIVALKNVRLNKQFMYLAIQVYKKIVSVYITLTYMRPNDVLRTELSN